MKLIALHDAAGVILAAARVSKDYSGPVPAAGDGAIVTEVEVPKTHEKLSLPILCSQLRVDIKSSKLVEQGAGKKR